jgi:NAD(P)-dependent dehydrogenase (short-subunit alcohol dehydrogenase family)
VDGDRDLMPADTGATAPDGAVAPVVVVTGSSRGIGAGIAAYCAGRGLRLGLCARSVPGAPAGADAVVASVDVRDADAVDRFAAAVVDRFGRIDAWVNNAGVLDPVGPLADADPAALADHVGTNVLGVAYGTAAFARHVRSRPGTGSLVNISSGAATSAYRGWAAYCASKAAVEMLTEVVGLEERGSGLLAYAVAPGVVDTDMQALIRSSSAEAFPDVARFHRLAEDGAFLTAAWVAACILERCVDPVARWEPEPGRGSVRFRVPDPPAAHRAIT